MIEILLADDFANLLRRVKHVYPFVSLDGLATPSINITEIARKGFSPSNRYGTYAYNMHTSYEDKQTFSHH